VKGKGAMKSKKAVFTFLATIGFTVLAYYVSLDLSASIDKSLLAGSVISIAGTLMAIAFFLGDWSADVEQSYEKLRLRIEADSEKLRTHLLDAAECMGSPEEAQKYILLMMRKVKSIANTHIKPLNPSHELATYTTSETHAKFKQAVSDLIYEREGRVRDVVYEPYVKYFLENRLHAPIHTLPATDKYQLASVSTDIRFVNYMILQYNDGKKTDVFFGWVYDPNRVTDVFRTSDQTLVRFFETHFEILFDHAKHEALPISTSAGP
jgi:hypothetical protein